MKNYPVLYNQNDYNDFLGFSTTATIRSGGCFVSSLAMKACFYGHQITPPDLNNLFKEKPIYVQTDLLPDNALSQVYNDINYIKTLDYEPIPTDIDAIASLLSDPAVTLTCRINMGNGNLHFVEVIDCDPSAKILHIANPLTGKIEDFSQNYGDPVTAKLRILVYSGVIISQAKMQISQTPPSPAPSPLATNFNNAITKSNNFDTVANYLGISAIARITTTSGQQVVEVIKALQESNQQLLTKLQDLKNEITVLTAANLQARPASEGAIFANGANAVVGNPPPPAPNTLQTPSSPSGQSVSANVSLIKRIFQLLFF